MRDVLFEQFQIILPHLNKLDSTSSAVNDFICLLRASESRFSIWTTAVEVSGLLSEAERVSSITGGIVSALQPVTVVERMQAQLLGGCWFDVAAIDLLDHPPRLSEHTENWEAARRRAFLLGQAVDLSDPAQVEIVQELVAQHTTHAFDFGRGLGCAERSVLAVWDVLKAALGRPDRRGMGVVFGFVQSVGETGDEAARVIEADVLGEPQLVAVLPAWHEAAFDKERVGQRLVAAVRAGMLGPGELVLLRLGFDQDADLALFVELARASHGNGQLAIVLLRLLECTGKAYEGLPDALRGEIAPLILAAIAIDDPDHKLIWAEKLTMDFLKSPDVLRWFETCLDAIIRRLIDGDRSQIYFLEPMFATLVMRDPIRAFRCFQRSKGKFNKIRYFEIRSLFDFILSMVTHSYRLDWIEENFSDRGRHCFMFSTFYFSSFIGIAAKLGNPYSFIGYCLRNSEDKDKFFEVALLNVTPDMWSGSRGDEIDRRIDGILVPLLDSPDPDFARRVETEIARHRDMANAERRREAEARRRLDENFGDD